MNEEVDNTQVRPALNTTRRGRTAVRAEQSASRGRSSNARRSSSSSRTSARGRKQSARHASQSSASRRSSASSHPPKRRGGVPVILVIVLLVIAVAASVFITRSVLTPQIEEAHKEAEVAKSQVSTLTKQLSSVAGNQSSSSTNTSSDSESNKDKESNANKGESAKGDGVDSPWTKSGKFNSGDAVLDSEVKAFCDSIANSSMDRNAAVLEVYKGVAWSEYVERDAAQHPAGKNWRSEYARMYYENGSSGNCYEFAAFLSYCMQYMGFDDAKAEGVLIELQGGGWGDHGIVFVTSSDGTKCVCDTARGTNGWMLPESTYNVQIQDFENA